MEARQGRDCLELRHGGQYKTAFPHKKDVQQAGTLHLPSGVPSFTEAILRVVYEL